MREAYLPELGLWLADYPFLNRDVFLDVSLEIERARQQPPLDQQGRQPGGGPEPGPGPAGGQGAPFYYE